MNTINASHISIAVLELSVRVTNVFKRASINTLGDLVAKTEKELLELPNFGKTCLEEVRYKLLDFDLDFKKCPHGFLNIDYCVECYRG